MDMAKIKKNFYLEQADVQRLKTLAKKLKASESSIIRLMVRASTPLSLRDVSKGMKEEIRLTNPHA